MNRILSRDKLNSLYVSSDFMNEDSATPKLISKIGLGSCSASASTSKTSQHPNNKSMNPHKRQASMNIRHSTFYANDKNFSLERGGNLSGSRYSVMTEKESNKKNSYSLPRGHQMFTKKYVSCENLRPLSLSYNGADDFEEIIDETSEMEQDTENGLKEKLMKRYNGLTTLLMRSFRKAKDKKKRESVMSYEPKLSTNFEEAPGTFTKNSQNNSFRRSIASPNSKRSATFNSNINRMRRTTSKSNTFINELNNSDDEEGDDLERHIVGDVEDAGKPVFLGVRKISNDFIDLTPTLKPLQSSKTSILLDGVQNRQKSDYQQQSKLSSPAIYHRQQKYNSMESKYSNHKTLQHQQQHNKHHHQQYQRQKKYNSTEDSKYQRHQLNERYNTKSSSPSSSYSRHNSTIQNNKYDNYDKYESLEVNNKYSTSNSIDNLSIPDKHAKHYPKHGSVSKSIDKYEDLATYQTKSSTNQQLSTSSRNLNSTNNNKILNLSSSNSLRRASSSTVGCELITKKVLPIVATNEEEYHKYSKEEQNEPRSRSISHKYKSLINEEDEKKMRRSRSSSSSLSSSSSSSKFKNIIKPTAIPSVKEAINNFNRNNTSLLTHNHPVYEIHNRLANSSKNTADPAPNSNKIDNNVHPVSAPVPVQLLFSSHLKPQAPQPPQRKKQTTTNTNATAKTDQTTKKSNIDCDIDKIINRIIDLNNDNTNKLISMNKTKIADTDPADKIQINNEQDNNVVKNVAAVVEKEVEKEGPKRSLTFTQQLHGMLNQNQNQNPLNSKNNNKISKKEFRRNTISSDYDNFNKNFLDLATHNNNNNSEKNIDICGKDENNYVFKKVENPEQFELISYESNGNNKVSKPQQPHQQQQEQQQQHAVSDDEIHSETWTLEYVSTEVKDDNIKYKRLLSDIETDKNNKIESFNKVKEEKEEEAEEVEEVEEVEEERKERKEETINNPKLKPWNINSDEDEDESRVNYSESNSTIFGFGIESALETSKNTPTLNSNEINVNRENISIINVVNEIEFSELVNVLSRQSDQFKKRFFDCLMVKLWDTTLPYDEYRQLNKLMTALFGEDYHKIMTTTPFNNEKNSKKQDAERIVDLIKGFLDKKTTKSDDDTNGDVDDDDNRSIYNDPTHPPFDDNDYSELAFNSVNNLINALKIRKTREEQYKTRRKERRVIEASKSTTQNQLNNNNITEPDPFKFLDEINQNKPSFDSPTASSIASSNHNSISKLTEHFVQDQINKIRCSHQSSVIESTTISNNKNNNFNYTTHHKLLPTILNSNHLNIANIDINPSCENDGNIISPLNDNICLQKLKGIYFLRVDFFNLTTIKLF
jgi:hypothetical protein